MTTDRTSMHLRKLTQLQDGIAMPLAIGMLLIVSIVAGAIASTSIGAGDEAAADRSAKRALAAAEAGIQVATSRLYLIQPPNDRCLTTVAVSPSGGVCPQTAAQSVGTGATFRYRVTQTNSYSQLGVFCAVVPGYPSTTGDRCITATGTVGGVTRRLQVRVNNIPRYIWAVSGLIGLESVTLTNNVLVEDTDVGSNGAITLTGSPTLVHIDDAAVRRGPNSTISQSGSVTIDQGVIVQTAEYVMPQADFEATLPAQGGTNNNNLLSATYYNATTRALTIPNGVTYNMPSGTYNLCSVELGAGSTLDMSSSSGKAKIYVDAPRRSGSGCASGGTFRTIGTSVSEAEMNVGRADANIFVYLWGTQADGSGEDVRMEQAHVDAVFYGPDSTFRATNDVIMHGGVAARRVVMDNAVDQRLDESVENETLPPEPPERKAWIECKPLPTTPSDPESGC